MQVLALCHKAGLASLEHASLGGTKIKANASKHKAISYARMVRAEAELAREMAEWLARAQAEDAAEDVEYASHAAAMSRRTEWARSKPG